MLSWLKKFNKTNNWRHGKEESSISAIKKESSKDKLDLSFSDYVLSNEKQLRTRKQISNFAKSVVEDRKSDKKLIVSTIIILGLE